MSSKRLLVSLRLFILIIVSARVTFKLCPLHENDNTFFLEQVAEGVRYHDNVQVNRILREPSNTHSYIQSLAWICVCRASVGMLELVFVSVSVGVGVYV